MTNISRCSMASPRWPMTAKDSRRGPIPSLSAETSRSIRSRVGSATGFACATAPVQSAVRVRHRTGAERTLRTALAAGATPQWGAARTLSVVTHRYFGYGGQALDFLEKALEG